MSTLLTTMGLGSLAAPGTPAAVAFQVLAVQNFGTHLIATFNNNLLVSGPGLDPDAYHFTGPSAIQATLVQVQVPGHLLKITITEQLSGGSYSVTLPSQGVMDVNGNIINGPFSFSFTGIGIPVQVQLARSIDIRTLDIIFSEAVMEADAAIPSKYSIAGLTVLRAERVTDLHYRLTTSPQALTTSYEVSVSGIRDINGNL